MSTYQEEQEDIALRAMIVHHEELQDGVMRKMIMCTQRNAELDWMEEADAQLDLYAYFSQHSHIWNGAPKFDELLKTIEKYLWKIYTRAKRSRDGPITHYARMYIEEWGFSCTRKTIEGGKETLCKNVPNQLSTTRMCTYHINILEKIKKDVMVTSCMPDTLCHLVVAYL